MTADDLTGFIDDRTKGHNCHKGSQRLDARI